LLLFKNVSHHVAIVTMAPIENNYQILCKLQVGPENIAQILLSRTKKFEVWDVDRYILEHF